MVAPIALLAITSLKEVADLRFVDSLGDSEISVAMRVKAVLIIASA
jgi:hypothetical protein